MKSRMKIDFFPLFEAIIYDASTLCGADRSEIRRDINTCRRRLKDEGLSFLTITLPNFGKAFELCLSQARVRQQDFQGWKFTAGLPMFLKGFLCDIFDSQGGLIDEPNVKAIEAVRQICLSFKKVGLDCTQKRAVRAVEKYVNTERTLRSAMLPVDGTSIYGTVADLLWGNMFHDFNVMECYPKHGPGAVVQGLTPNGKWALNDWPEKVEAIFPRDWFGSLNASELVDRDLNYNTVPRGHEYDMKMSLVPKTLKTPRIIAISACEMQYLQQAIKDYLVEVLEKSAYTSGHINFSDQSVNQKMAIEASTDGKSATLDLSEASDRVLLSLVRHTFRSCPNLLEALEVTREDVVKLPFIVKINDNIAIRKLRLRKFAGMGSATCFPVEAMVFFTIIVTALIESRSLRPTLRNIYKCSRDVYVYGDDLIVPVDEAPVICEWLERFSCRVNREKSFSTGYFRESCGVDAYGGVNVTPTYVRAAWPTDHRNSSEIQSFVATGNQLYERGFFRSARYIRDRIECVTGPLPCCEDETFAGMSWSWRDGLEKLRTRFNRNIQTVEVNCLVSGPSRFDDPIDDYRALLKTLSGMDRECTARRGARVEVGEALGSRIYTYVRSRSSTTVIPKAVGQKATAPKFRPVFEAKASLIETKSEVSLLRWALSSIEPQRSERHGASTLKRRWVSTTV